MPDVTDGRPAVFIDGCRTPFLRSGTAFADQTSYDLARMALKGLLSRNDLDPGALDRVVMGTVVQNVQTPNVAREAALAAGIPVTVPASTVSMACISSNQALTVGMNAIRCGEADVVVAGGTEALSDVPILFRKSVRRKLFEARKLKSPADYARLLRGLRPSDLLPETPAIAEYSTGKSMGESAEELAAAWSVSREQMDEYAYRSHHLAAEAWQEGRLGPDVVPVAVPPEFEPVAHDNGVRADTTMEKLRSLRPAFVKTFGRITAGNSSYLTDGASAALITSPAAAEARGLRPRARLGDYVYVAQEPGEELLLGPAFAIPKLLDRTGLTLADIDVFELHEAFAGQVLAVLAALDSASFAERLGRAAPVGEIPRDRLNTWGGSLSLGHPFGATGVRLVTTAARRLEAEDGEVALVAACAAGGLGHAMLVYRT